MRYGHLALTLHHAEAEHAVIVVSLRLLSTPQAEILSGLVVAFAMIPEAIAFPEIAGADPQVGLFGAFCLSVTIFFVSGR